MSNWRYVERYGGEALVRICRKCLAALNKLANAR